MTDKTKAGFVQTNCLKYEMARQETSHIGQQALIIAIFCAVMFIMGFTHLDALGFTMIGIGLAFSHLGYGYLANYISRKRTCHGLQRSF